MVLGLGNTEMNKTKIIVLKKLETCKEIHINIHSKAHVYDLVINAVIGLFI